MHPSFLLKINNSLIVKINEINPITIFYISLPLFLTLSLSLSLPPSLPPSFYLSPSLSLPRSFFLSFSLSLLRTLARKKNARTLIALPGDSLPLSHTHTHSLSPTLPLSFSLSLSLSHKARTHFKHSSFIQSVSQYA